MRQPTMTDLMHMAGEARLRKRAAQQPRPPERPKHLPTPLPAHVRAEVQKLLPEVGSVETTRQVMVAGIKARVTALTPRSWATDQGFGPRGEDGLCDRMRKCDE